MSPRIVLHYRLLQSALPLPCCFPPEAAILSVDRIPFYWPVDGIQGCHSPAQNKWAKLSKNRPQFPPRCGMTRKCVPRMQLNYSTIAFVIATRYTSQVRKGVTHDASNRRKSTQDATQAREASE